MSTNETPTENTSEDVTAPTTTPKENDALSLDGKPIALSSYAPIRNRKRFIAVALIGTLMTIGGAGTVTASLTNDHTISTENKVFLNTNLNLETTPNSQVISKNLTPGQPAETFTVEVQNVGELDANYGIYVIDADKLQLPEVALDNTTVSVRSVGDSSWNYTTNLRGFVDNATISDWSQDGERVIKPGAIKTFQITITPDSSGSEWTQEDFGNFSMTFTTKFIASQVAGGTSDLLDYARENGTVVADLGPGLKVFAVPAGEALAASQGK
jgi:hypothetical protein